MRYLREWKNPDKGGECGTYIPSRLAGPGTQLGSKDAFFVVKKPNRTKRIFQKYQPSQVLAGLEVKPSLQVFPFCTVCIGHVPLQATLLCSRRANGAPELPAASHCPDRAACTSQAHRAGRGPSPPRQDVLTSSACIQWPGTQSWGYSLLFTPLRKT